MNAAAERFGRYELLAPLASGGMAELHLARIQGVEGFQKTLVVKVIHPHHADNAEFVELFLQEARLAATLDHPNIVQVHDAGVVEGTYFIAMEYVHGMDLRAVLSTCSRSERTLSLDESLTIALGVCAGLHYAHEKRGPDGAPLGIIHRDISPANVLLGLSGGVKLADFGIARAASRQSITKPGAVRGKVRYMSPEQVRGLPLDRRSDLFSLGILLYEMTTCSNAYSGRDDVEVMRRIVSGPPPLPSRVAPGFPPELEAIIQRALALDPCERFSTAEELQLALEHFARERRLAVSSITLARLLETLFPAQIEVWREAQRTQQSIVEFVAQTRTLNRTPSGASPRVAAPASPEPRTEVIPGRVRGSGFRRAGSLLALGALIVATAALGWTAWRGGVPSPTATKAPAAAEAAQGASEDPSAADAGAADLAEPSAPAPAAPSVEPARPKPPEPVVRRPVAKRPAAGAKVRPAKPPAGGERPAPRWDPDSPLPPP